MSELSTAYELACHVSATSVDCMPEPIPALPRTLTAPEPVIVVGMVGFLIATVLVVVWDLGTDNTLTICLVGLGVGLFGCFVVSLQRWAIRRGSRAAQDGLS